MDQQKFEQGKTLKKRIFELIVLKETLKQMFEHGAPFRISVKLSSFGCSFEDSIGGMSGSTDRFKDSEDSTFLLEAIDARIQQIEKEFEEL